MAQNTVHQVENLIKSVNMLHFYVKIILEKQKENIIARKYVEVYHQLHDRRKGSIKRYSKTTKSS